MNSSACLSFPPLQKGVLLHRYKRFFADIRLDTGKIITAHCPNTGRMTGCCEPGREVWAHHSNIPARKLQYDWFLIHMPDTLVGVRTQLPNDLIAHAARMGLLDTFETYTEVTREVSVSPHSRMDLKLQSPAGKSAYIEIKNCSWVENGIAYFPDAVTRRGQKHLKTLMELATTGDRAALIIVIQRMDALFFKPAFQIDPTYATLFETVRRNGVEILIFDTILSPHQICLGKQIPLLHP